MTLTPSTRTCRTAGMIAFCFIYFVFIHSNLITYVSISGRSIVMDNNMMRGGMDHHANEEQQIPSLKHPARNGYANLHGAFNYLLIT